MEQMIILQTMLDRANYGKHNLGMECLVSVINKVTDNKLTLVELADACEHALCEWDI